MQPPIFKIKLLNNCMQVWSRIYNMVYGMLETSFPSFISQNPVKFRYLYFYGEKINFHCFRLYFRNVGMGKCIMTSL